MDQTPTTRLSLLVRLRDPHDERAWTEVMEIYTPIICRLARSKGLQDADIADLIQEVFSALSMALERGLYNPEKGSFRGWLFCIARNLAVNLLINRGRHPQGTGDTDMMSLLDARPAPNSVEDSAFFDIEFKRQILYWAADQVRHEFSELTWQAFWQSGVMGQSPREVASALGTTVGTVYYYKSRVMARLRQKIDEVESEEE